MPAKREWADAKCTYPESGWYLVVVEGHSTRLRKVDYFDGDDMQWRSEYKDRDVKVTHYMDLPPLPAEKEPGHDS